MACSANDRFRIDQERDASMVEDGPEREALTTQDLILHAAARAFLASGYEGVSMDRIAAESGVGRRTLYNRFESKKALFDATVAHIWGRMPLRRKIDADHIDTPHLALTDIGNAIASFWAPADAIAFARMIIAESMRFPELGASFLKFGRGPARTAVSGFFAQLSDTERLHVPDPELAASQFLSMINGPLLWDRIVGDLAPPDEERRHYVVSEAVKVILARYGV